VEVGVSSDGHESAPPSGAAAAALPVGAASKNDVRFETRTRASLICGGSFNVSSFNKTFTPLVLIFVYILMMASPRNATWVEFMVLGRTIFA
jgi:hypothetical protein